MIKNKCLKLIKRLKTADKKKILAFVLVLLVCTSSFTQVTYADSIMDTIKGFATNALDTALSFLLRLFGDILYTLFFSTGTVNSIDNIVYNQGGSGLTLNEGSGNKLTQFFIEFYLFFQYMAIVFFVPIGLWFTISFVRAGEDSQKRAECKEKGMRLFVTFVWLTAMPQILEWIFIANNVLVDVFYSITKGIVGGNTELLKNGLILGYMRDLAHDTKTTVHAITYLMTIFVNLWMVFYYFIRDITISFLFMIFPILAVIYPLKKGAVINWWKEMASNILTQTIHAMVMSSVIAMAYFMSPQVTGKEMDFTDSMYVLTAFAMVIPFTSIIKSMVGLEGSLGGAKSLAGLGAMYGAFRLGSMGISGLKQGLGGLKSGLTEGFAATSDYITLKKKGQTDPLTGKLTATNKLGQEITMDDVKKRLKEAGEKTLRGGGATITGLTAGLGTTAGTMALGNPTNALMLGAGASYVGAKFGSFGGSTVANTISGSKGLYDFGKLAASSQQEKDATLGLTSPVLQNTEYKAKEQRALMAEKFFKTFGMNTLGNLSYSMLTNKDMPLDKINGLKEAELYVDKNQSVLYGTDANGNRRIIRTGKGDSSITTPYTRQVSFNDGSLELSDIQKDNLRKRAEDLAYTDIGADMDTRASQILKDNGLEQGTPQGDALYEELTGGALLDSNNQYFDRQLSISFEKSKSSHYNRLEKAELSKLKKIRDNLGIDSLTFSSDSRDFIGTHMLFDTEAEIQAMATKSVEADGLVKVQNYPEGVASNLNGVGYALASKTGTTFYQVLADGSRKAIWHSDKTTKVGASQIEMYPVKYENGEILRDQVKYALEGTGFYSVPPTEAQAFDSVNERLGEDIISKIQPNSQIMVTVALDEASNTGTYGVFNRGTGQYIGSYEIPQSYLGTEQNGHVYHIQVDALGNFLQQGGSHAMTDVDYHIASTSFNTPVSRWHRQEAQLQQIEIEKQRIRSMLAGLYNDDTVHQQYIQSIQ
jgi:hypothetical protein